MSLQRLWLVFNLRKKLKIYQRLVVWWHECAKWVILFLTWIHWSWLRLIKIVWLTPKSSREWGLGVKWISNGVAWLWVATQWLVCYTLSLVDPICESWFGLNEFDWLILIVGICESWSHFVKRKWNLFSSCMVAKAWLWFDPQLSIRNDCCCVA